LFSVVIFGRIIYLQFYIGNDLRKKAKTLTTKNLFIPATRGNIYAQDGSLLATSVPIYETAVDLTVSSITDEIFENEVDSLAYCLANLFKNKTAREYSKELKTQRREGRKYYIIKRNVKYYELKKMKSFPILRRGKFKGGFIYLQQNKRALPFRSLAERTIGYERIIKNKKKVDTLKIGIEGAYSKILAGISGVTLVQKISGSDWIPIYSSNQLEPQDGYDIYTTIDINFQDVAEHALYTQLKLNNADHGCVVLMEVGTGKIRAIANLKRISEGVYKEVYNYVIGESTEPGSTFKLASILTAIEQGKITLHDSVNTGNGKYKFHDKWMNDSHEGGYGTISVQKSIELSSNVAISKIIYNNYSKNPKEWIDGIYKTKLNEKTGIDIYGEANPFIKDPKDKFWSGVSLPWMSIGYEVQLTPLQILTFYNAIANNGYRVRPIVVEEIKSKGQSIKKIEPIVDSKPIFSSETIKAAKIMLEGVVKNGTAKNLSTTTYQIAGKTGTALVADRSGKYKGNKRTYQASFVGYFPADNPKYSCIVVINDPSKNAYYGNIVAGPIFKEIADKVYATNLSLHEELGSKIIYTSVPISKNGYYKDLQTVLDTLKIPCKKSNETWVKTNIDNKKVNCTNYSISEKYIPLVVGMGAQDAIHILEEKGLNVLIKGRGFVINQSIKNGMPIIKGDTIILNLG